MSEEERRKIEQDQRSDTDRIFTLPNILSFFRMALIPLIVYFYEQGQYGWAAGMLVLSFATDVIDGWIARTFHLVSDFGKAIDPVADKLTQVAVLLCLLPMRLWWVVGVMAVKEISIGVLTIIALKRTHNVYSAGWYGKVCTGMIYLSMFVLMLWQDVPAWFVTVDAIVLASLILLSFFMYFVYFSRILRQAEKQA